MTDVGPGLARQGEIYARGLQGERPLIPTDSAGLEAGARAKMSPEGFAYVAGGAGREQTMAPTARRSTAGASSRAWPATAPGATSR